MSLHHELLWLSREVLGLDPDPFEQACLRRAISTAYYALFHLLTAEAARVFIDDAEAIARLSRAYSHRDILKASELFSQGTLPWALRPLKGRFSEEAYKPTWERLQSVAKTFVDLQKARQKADYDLTIGHLRTEAEAFITQAELAFADWDQIRGDDLTRLYLSSFLACDVWSKER